MGRHVMKVCHGTACHVNGADSLDTTVKMELGVEAALEGDRDKLFWSIAYDPLTAAVLSLAEIKAMVNEMFEQNRDYLPQFKVHKV